MKKASTKINVVFTGKYLKYWYIACVVVLTLLLYDHYRNLSVKSYELTIFANDGTVRSVHLVEMDSIDGNNAIFPVNRSYRPIK